MRLLVPLDGSALAETVLAPAAFLAAALSAPSCGRLHLIRVLPSSGFTEAGGASGRLKQRARDHAQAYLQAQSQRLREGAMGQLSLSVTTSVVFQSNVADALVQVAEATQPDAETAEAGERCDIIALSTHGLSGLSHPRIGSTAARILQEVHLPVLVVHQAEDAQQSQENAQPMSRPQEERNQWMDSKDTSSWVI